MQYSRAVCISRSWSFSGKCKPTSLEFFLSLKPLKIFYKNHNQELYLTLFVCLFRHTFRRYKPKNRALKIFRCPTTRTNDYNCWIKNSAKHDWIPTEICLCLLDQASYYTKKQRKCSANHLHLSLCMRSIKTWENCDKHWTNNIYVLFSWFINNKSSRKERDCADQEIT